MSNIVEECLYNALNELIEKQFKEFKWKLNRINYAGEQNIPRASLDKADEQDVVDLMIQHYGEDALEVCIDVLLKCNRKDLAKNLEKTRKKDVDAHQFVDSSEYRNYIKKKFETMKDPNAVPGEYVPLKQRYSKLIILDYHPSEEEREDEILAIGRKHFEIISKRAESSASIETLFNPDKYGLIPQVVVLQGAAGIGKTIMAKKIMFDWASQLLYQDKFNYAFYICCRKLNLHSEAEKSSIAEIISEEWLKRHELKNVIGNILKNEEKLLFIIDGFDEFRYSFDQPKDSSCTDPWKKEPVRILLNSLFQKKLLPKSSLIITTRPTALEKLHQFLEHSRNFEILGFSTREREEYFYKFFENEDQATQVLRFVKQSDTLFTMCVIPLVSWIICTVMKQEMKRGKDLQKTPYTLTAIYMLYFSSLLKFHHKESKQDVQSNVKGLCSLAAEGVWEQKTLFMKEEVKKHSLDHGNFLPLFLNQSIFKRGIDCIQTFSFIHLSFQEFFAALFYVLEEGDEQHSENQNKNLQALLERHKSFRPDFAVGFRFLFGFLNEGKRMRELKKEFGWEISPKNKEFLLDCIKNNITKRRCNFQLQKEMFNYLYETQDDNFIKNAICDSTEIDYQCNSDMELMILGYCIQHCQNLKYLFVKGSEFLHYAETESFLPEKEEWSLDERYMEDFFKALTKLKNLSILRLEGWSFTESCSRHLVEVLRKNQRLKELVLEFLKDTDETAVDLLCEGLQHPDCVVETLSIEITNESNMRHLADVIRKNQRLRCLFLAMKNLNDKTMEILCEGLKHPQCTIERLQIDGEIANESNMRHLADVFSKNQRLRDLLLSINNLNDNTMEVLCDGLKHPQCIIETLLLCGENTNESYMKHLTEVFRKNQSLRELCLFLKNPDDRAIKVLCEGLKYPQCTIEGLKLGGEITNESYTRHLVEVFRENQRLRQLALSLNNPDNRAMEVLFEGLQHPECSIEMLLLDGEIANESYVRYLTQVFGKNQRLRELFLSLKNPDDPAMEVLFEDLEHPECSIEVLQLDGEIANESYVGYLTQVFRKKQRLRGLFLSLKNPNDPAMEILCESLKHPQCTIERLELCGENTNESYMKHLTEVFRKNQSLRELCLFLKNPDDRAIKVLCEGLKYPQCTIEGLKLGGEITNESYTRHLVEVFRENQRLRQLALSLNNPDNRAMEVLFEGLQHPECSIEMLLLDGEIANESYVRYLTQVFGKNQRLRELFLSLKNPDDPAMEVLFEDLEHPECSIEVLQLDGEIANESYVGYLTQVFRKKQRLRGLFLSLKNPNDPAMEILCESLKHPQCTIERLELFDENTNESYMRHLTEVFRKNQSLRELCLFLKNPDDRAIKVLCEGLKHPQCTIEGLKLGGEITNESYTRHLAEAFRENQRLRQLCLSLKNPNDRAMEVLFEGLQHPECSIEMLQLDGEIANESYVRYLTELFRKNQRLRKLFLSLKNPDGTAMEILCEGLKHPQCTIEQLQLGGENTNESYMRHLTEVFKENQRLRHLCLSLKNPDDRAMEVLFEGLKHPQCTIEKLQLGGENTNESYMRHLTKIFRKNQRLRELSLSLNNADDRVIKILCEGLKHPECTIERLELGGENTNESYMRHLTEVFRKNQRLRQLCFSPKNPDDRAVEVLCDGLKHPECTIETLVLDGESANESYMRYLTEVLRNNQGLRELCLSLKNPDDKAMEVLCEGLKHPECTIEQLQLGGEIENQSYMRNLAEVFRQNHRLRQLSLNLDNPDDRGMEVLCKGLKHPECSIDMVEWTNIIQNGK
ncbi:NACHT, LRR and PYD domains-containing protein 12-like isoform X2 [Crotalus tigris]|uniref:NACHT, LRR and PYD domains-containing protein 12-like isoform X2 n=1 Tax=Crotalus tigris TaxID=88082 RepID=UPI00192F9B54|nr:NACHT, LRR and PYD domains-containing protein 12-like isoform X2 [Crotalus tigris]